MASLTVPPVDLSLMPARLPEGFAAAPLAGEDGLRVCVVVRKGAGGAPGLLILRESFDGRAVLGCVSDAAGTVHLWTEVHIQTPEAVQGAPPIFGESISNAVLDARWKVVGESLAGAGAPGGLIATGWETANPRPMFIDPGTMSVVRPVDAKGRPWELCRDEALLASRGLPGYAATLHRYLYVQGGEGPLVPVTPEAPTNKHTGTASELMGGKALIPLNPGAGLMLVRPRSPVSYEAFLEALSAEPAKAVLRVSPFPDADGKATTLHLVGDAGLMLSRHGRWGRLVETLHLKLRLLADAVSGVRGAVAKAQAPMLNLSADSLRVDLGAPGAGLPLLWTARANLVAPGDAVALSVPGADAEYYLRDRQAASVYAPDSVGRAVQGRASVRIRKVEPDGRPGIAIVSGTLATQERIRPAPSDLVWIRLHLSGGRGAGAATGGWVDLYARLEQDAALAPGEWRFRTVPQKFPDSAGGVAAVKAAEGVLISDAPFHIVALLSSPCDLYSLGVLGVRTLLVGPDKALPEALDEMLSLARQSGEGQGELALRIAALFAKDGAWADRLGPHRLADGVVTSGREALDLVPLDLWCRTLGAMVRMFPGLPDSACRDVGDAPAGGLQRVFDRAVADLDDLLIRTRSLIVIDWRANREMHAVIRGCRTGLSPTTAKPAPTKAAARA